MLNKGVKMKNNKLILMTLVPVVTGYILNLTLLIPGIGTLSFYLLPCITLIFWFYLGGKYAKTSWNIIQATIIGNGIGLISLLLYFWQFWGRSDENRNIFISALSQNFVANTNLVTAKYAILFEPTKNTFTQTTSTAMQILGLLLMIIIFLGGYVFGKVRGSASPKHQL